MASFHTSIVVDAKEFYFQFNKVVTPEGVKYFVNVLDLRGVLTSFEVKDRYEGDWYIVLPAPQWILDAGPAIFRAIAAHADE